MNCKVHYFNNYISLFCNIQGNIYCVEFIANKTTIFRILPSFKHTVIAQIDHIANITPTNIVGKLKTYLVFS